VPVADVVDSFETLMETDFFVQNQDMLASIINYYEDTWIGRPQGTRRRGRRTPTFAHGLWNVFNAVNEDDARTNNAIEGWHRRFSTLSGAHHPTLWKFITTLKLEQGHTEFRLAQLTAGASPPAKRRKYRDMDKRIRRNVSKYDKQNPTFNLEDYLSGLASNLVYQV
jgi:hypothetical protein